ncbi:uncharacterized protein LOC120903980 [Anopheles arabiensis]|uniref:Uncharacterized protein n=1 Tax=Anopheles arabiensis TaxID=7173 RepID=A0A182HUP2_ANOAR|nr:uncharacterized protein LOC120903980 [Anopheles arabiensis]
MKFVLKCLAIFLAAILCSIAEGNKIRCYSCDDCNKQEPEIVQCSAKNGMDLNALSYNPTYPILTPSTPYWNANPWDPLLTPPPLVGNNNGGAWYPGYPGYPILTPPPLGGGGINQQYPWDPLLTPPPLVGNNNGGAWYPGNPILTPPTTYYPYGKAHQQTGDKGQKRFVCATIRRKGKDLQTDIVHRRGCAEIEGLAVGVCDQGQIPVTEGGITSCRVCGHSLCNE